MTAVAERILWQPNAGPQTDFLACPAREALFAGSVGAGKTDSLLMAAASQVGNGLHRALLLRRSFPMLRDVIARSHELFLPLGAQYRKAENQWTFPSGAVIEFGYLDADGDEHRYMGRAFSFLGWDELTTWPGDGTDSEGKPCSRAYLYMLSRLRAVEGSGLRMEVRATCTPGGIGHNWVRARWNIPDDGSSSEVIDPQTGYRRVFIRATIADNPFLAGTSYERSLAALPEATRKALLLGRWDIFEGTVFSEWDPKIHVCDPFPVPNEWPMWRGADDGFAAPAACYWLAHDTIHDRIYVTAELYASGMTPQTMASAVLAIDGQHGRRGSMKGVIDSASFADTGLGGGRGDQMNKLGCRWEPSIKGAGSRLAGKALIHARLALRSDRKPGLIVFKTCKNLIRTLPSLPYDKAHPEDVAGNVEDHAYEALRTALTFKMTRTRLIPTTGL